MEIHELNTKGITNPAYVALDDGTDTYKLDLNAKLSAINDALDEDATNINKLLAEHGIFFCETATAAATSTKVVTSSEYGGRDGEYIAVKFTNGNTASSISFTVGNLSNGTVAFPGHNSAPNIKANQILLFRVTDEAGLNPNPVWKYTFVGYYPVNATTSVDGLMSSSDKAALDTAVSDISDLKSDLTTDTKWVDVELTYTDGGYIKPNDGAVASYSTWHYTGYVDIRANNDSNKIKIACSIESVGSIEYNAFYNSSQQFISSFSCNAGEITIPTGAQYVRLSYPKASEFVQTLSIVNNTIHGNYEKDIASINADAIYTKGQMEFEPGGISTSTGKDYNGAEQLNRLRSKFSYAYKPLKIYLPKALSSPLTGIWFMVFYWASNDPTSNCSSNSGWFRLPDAYTYTIPEGSYFRVLAYSEQYTQEITDVKSNIVYKAFDISAPLPIQNSVEQMNTEMIPFVQSLKATYPTAAKSYFSATHTPLTFVHFSDIHNKPALWKRIAEFTDDNSDYLSFALHTGDYVGDNQTSYTDLYNYYMPTLPFLNCVGNHDTYANAQHATATKQSVYEKLFNHTDNWGVTFDTNLSYPMTYYKDFSGSNIRLIVYDNYYDIASQITWISNILADAKSNGMAVITASHQVTGRPSQKIDCTFQTLIPYDTAGTGSVLNTDFDAVIGSFISGGGKHIVHLCGHEHQDWFYKTANGVLNCAVECATDDTVWTEGARVVNSKTMDCFNAVGVDIDLGVLKIVRIGANSDSHNRAINLLAYDYVNETVLFNS